MSFRVKPSRISLRTQSCSAMTICATDEPATTSQKKIEVARYAQSFGFTTGGTLILDTREVDELVVVLFIASRRVFTLPRKIWDGINENLDPAMAAVAVLLVGMTVLLLLLDLALRRQRAE